MAGRIKRNELENKYMQDNFKVELKESKKQK